MIRNFAVVGPGQATRERLTAALQAAPDMAVYRIGRGADPLPVSATFDPADQSGCRTLLDWFERGARTGAVLLVDDWSLCAQQDPGLGRTVEWIAAFGPARGVQTVVTARKWTDLPPRLRKHLHGEPTDFLALHGIDADLGDMWLRDDLTATIGVDDRGWPVDFNLGIGGAVHRGTPEQLRCALLGFMATHSADRLQYLLVDGTGSGVFEPLSFASQVAHMITPADHTSLPRLADALAGELGRRQEARKTGEPAPDLLVCVDGPEAVFHREPVLREVLLSVMRAGRTLGLHVLYSGGDPRTPYELPEWPLAVPTFDLDEMLDLLPHAPGAGTAREILLPPLGHDGEPLPLDVLPPGAIGVLDKPYEHRRDVLVPEFTAELRHGAIVGAPGTGKSTALRTLAAVLGDLGSFQLLDGPGEPLDPQRHVVVTARTWEQVPPFIRDSLALGVELRLDDPATSLVNPRSAAAVPHLPGIGLSVRDKTAVQIALP
ncbi:hypothetical protein SAMN05216553_102232 [Lentzea fradiae]|uniref:Cyclic nucleotide-binding domain-containing protein n=1 Tax=Lentzea fradiae TaxID=200378 RepID=A0A1G7MDE3_9PSEU|nr:hypothetical protein [Lentzea fradiae]SDF59686.1 hypothetical protein SAMN05216553_102232 [Lentzea fradiae]